MSFLDDLLDSDTIDGVRSTVVGYAQAAQLAITSWLIGDVGQQTFEAVTNTMYHYTRVVARIVRGFASIDTSTDPGDVDAYDANNVNLAPVAGFLSFVGENTYGTTRTGQTFASGSVTFVNDGPLARTFGPGSLVFTRSTGSPPPTYRNAPASSIYTNPDGTVTIGPGADPVELPVVAVEIGTGSNAAPGSLSLTTALVGCSATNAASVTATEREDADVYRSRCKQAMSRLSFGAPQDAIEYLAAKTLDGEPLLNASGNPVNINRATSTNDSDTGEVTVYYASPSGAASSEDVDAANENIEANAYAVMDAVTFTGSSAIVQNIVIEGTAKIQRRAGLPAASVIEAKISAAVLAAFPSFPIGGRDQTAGVGRIYHVDIIVAATNAYPGLYDVELAVPIGDYTSLDEDEVAVPVSAPTDWTVTIVS